MYFATASHWRGSRASEVHPVISEILGITRSIG